MVNRQDLILRLKEFMENEARSCSMDFACVTPLYVYRMWGGQYPMEDIECVFAELRNKGKMDSWRLVHGGINRILIER